MPETAVLATALIVGRPMCRDCIARKAGLTADAVDCAIATIQKVLRLRRSERAACTACQTIGVVFWVDRP
jgi:hypothetical protein